MSTVAATVTTMTAVSERGIARRVAGRTECQSKVAAATNIITPTSAAMGICATKPPKATTSTSRNTPARNVEIRVRAPFALTFIMVCPTTAQPPMPPNNPETTFATPCPQDSRVLSERVSVMSSTSFAVSRDSSSPTNAMPMLNGRISHSVSHVSGTSGRPSAGNASGSAPRSPTRGTARPAAITRAVTTTTATSVAGTAVVSRGNSTTIARANAVSGYTSHGTPISSGSCEVNTRMANALTNPTITERGTNRMSRATPNTPSRIWMTPPRMIAASRCPTPYAWDSGATTSATAPVAAEIMAGRPPTIAVVTAMVKDANSPTRGSTPAMIENAMASGIRASATTTAANTSVPSSRGLRRVRRTDCRWSGVRAGGGAAGKAGMLPRVAVRGRGARR